MLVEVERAGFVPGGEFQAEAAVAVGLVPQVVEQLDQDVVVGGQVEGAMESRCARSASSPHGG